MSIWVVFENLRQSNATERHSAERFASELLAKGVIPSLMSAQDMSLQSNEDGFEFLVHLDGHIEKMPMPDAVLSRTSVDTSPATFALYEALQQSGVPVINTPHAMRLADNKIASAIAFKKAGLPSPDFVVASPSTSAEEVIEHLGLPVIAKKAISNGGKGVLLLETIQQVRTILMTETDLLFQKYIAKSRGRDYRLLVVGGEVVAAMERKSTSGDFRANASQGGHAEKLVPSSEMSDIALRSSKLLGLEIAGVDLLDSADGPLLCELNSSPGALKLEEVTGADIFAAKVDYALQRAFTF